MLLEVKNLDSGYGFLQVLWKASLQVATGEFICLIGPNGAGKSTMLKTICGLMAPIDGEILFKNRSIIGLEANRICQLGLSYISEETNLFTGMTVRENLTMGAYTVKDHKKKAKTLDFVYGLFPKLYERRDQLAGTMSGGERKMLAIGRGIMANPELLLVDEPSLGLAPQVTSDVFKSLDILRQSGMTLVLVEQNVKKTLQATDRGYILEKGRIIMQGPSTDLAQDDHVRKVFLGV
ncbi:MAG: ABC transporter ATP-binding protein [Deltaproteobacteria bacterium]|nr:ABC transporter ATP-binding protein [Deltaproteobacteria bacterium]